VDVFNRIGYPVPITEPESGPYLATTVPEEDDDRFALIIEFNITKYQSLNYHHIHDLFQYLNLNSNLMMNSWTIEYRSIPVFKIRKVRYDKISMGARFACMTVYPGRLSFHLSGARPRISPARAPPASRAYSPPVYSSPSSSLVSSPPDS
jgi:hypothetical protein